MSDVEYADAKRGLSDDWKPGMMAKRLIAIDAEFRALDAERLQAMGLGPEERRSRLEAADANGRALLDEKQRLEKFLEAEDGRR